MAYNCFISRKTCSNINKHLRYIARFASVICFLITTENIIERRDFSNYKWAVIVLFSIIIAFLLNFAVRLIRNKKQKKKTRTAGIFDKIIRAKKERKSYIKIIGEIDKVYKAGGTFDSEGRKYDELLKQKAKLTNYIESPKNKRDFMSMVITIFCGGVIVGLVNEFEIKFVFCSDPVIGKAYFTCCLIGLGSIAVIIMTEAFSSAKGDSDIYIELAKYELDLLSKKIEAHQAEVLKQESRDNT